jgi:hypothetical protein
LWSQVLQSWFMKNIFLRTAISNILLTVLCCVLLMVNVCRFALWLAFRMWILLIIQAKYFGSHSILKFSLNMCHYFVPFCYNVAASVLGVPLWDRVLLAGSRSLMIISYLITYLLTYLLTHILTYSPNYLLNYSHTYLLTYIFT